MSYTGILSLEDICHYGKRCTATEKITKKLSTGQSKAVVQCKKYIIQKDKVSEEMIYYTGKRKQIILKDPIPLKELYPTIKHVYDQNGVLDWSKKKWSLALYRKRDGAFDRLN